MIIYKITNKVDGKLYVGQTVQKLKKRWSDHCSANRKRDGQSYLYNAIQKHGKDSFLVEQIDSASTLEGLNALEEFYIKKFDTMSPKGYNLLPGGSNRRQHEDTKRKLSEALKGRPIPNRWTKGNCTSPSEATRGKIAEKLKGRAIEHRYTGGNKAPRTEEQKAHLSRLNKGKSNSALNKKVLVVETGAVYESVDACARAFGVARTTISHLLKSGKTHRKLSATLKYY